MNNESPTLLWERIATYAIDDPGAAYPYSRKLASEHGWSDQFATRVVEEYRRFIYLGMVAGHPVAPSDAVDQAWHLHQLYSSEYWGNFCPNVLGRPFNHGPSRGGSDENSKFARLYDETKISYQRIFNEAPPEDIWPATEVQFTGHHVRIDLNEHLVIRTKDFPVLCRMVGAILNLTLWFTRKRGKKVMKTQAVAILMAIAALSSSASSFPTLPSEPVLDQGHMLTDTQRDTLNNKVGGFMAKTSMQIRLVTIDDVSPYRTASEYAEDLYHSWQLGDPNKHNGLLLVITRHTASNSGNMKDYCRIMTGWGTRQIMSDDFIVNVVKHGFMMPNLPEHPYLAFDQAMDRMIAEIEGWRASHPDDATVQPGSSGPDAAAILLIIVIVVLAIVVIGVMVGGNSGGGYYGGSSGNDSSTSSCGNSCGSGCGGGCGGGGCSG